MQLLRMTRFSIPALACAILAGSFAVSRVRAQQQGAQPPAASQAASRGGRGGRGGRGNAFSNLTITTTAWPDGGMIPLRYTQAGPEVSPAVQWSTPPANTTSFVLVFHDADALAGNSTDDLLLWLLWNIPGTATGLPQNVADGFELPDGTRQISVSGSRYRGPGASSTGPMHHYVLDLYALDSTLDVRVNPQGPQDPNPNVQTIRTSVFQAMAGHVRGKAAYLGLFRRPE